MMAAIAACGCGSPVAPDGGPVDAGPAVLDATGTERVIDLPLDLSGVEGIAIDPASRALFVGEWRRGRILRGVLPEVAGDEVRFETFADDEAWSDVIGLAVDASGRRLVAAGGRDGDVRVFDLTSAALIASVPLDVAPGAIVNDVAVGPDGAIFATVSSRTPAVFEVVVEPEPRAEVFVDYGDEGVIPIFDFLLNGIVVGEEAILVCHTRTGQLFRLDRTTREVVELDVGRAEVARDGLAVVRDLLIGADIADFSRDGVERLTLTRLADGWRGATLERDLVHDGFQSPTTLAALGDRLYVVNAKFGLPVSARPFTVFSLPLPR